MGVGNERVKDAQKRVYSEDPLRNRPTLDI